MSIFERLYDWFDERRRKAIYAAVAALAPVLVASGVISEGQTGSVLIIASAALQAASGVLLLANLRMSEVGAWFITAGRAAIYGLAAAVAPAAVALGWVTESNSANALTWISLGLTALAAIVGIANLTPDEKRKPRHAAETESA